MTGFPLISVIMPLFNKRHYVRRAVESVVGQTFADWELIVIDDGSTDGSAEEVPAGDGRIRLLRQENAGPGAARNHGIREAKGEYVAFLDADDYYYPHKLDEDVRLLHKEKKAEWMISAFDLETAGRVKPVYIRDRGGNEIKGRPSVFDNALEQLRIQFWHTNGMSARRTLLERIGGFQESMRWLEITEIQIRCALAQSRIIVSPVPSHRVVDVPESASKVSSHRMHGMKQMGERLYEFSKSYPAFSDILLPRSRESFLSYVSVLITSGSNTEARRFLTRDYPYEHDRKWWKFWAGSWLPARVIERLVGPA